VRTIADLDELARLVGGSDDLYVRWSHGPDRDLERTSRDELTGGRLPGLSANPLTVEPWWGNRPVRLWVARRIYDYLHLEHRRPSDVRPWVMRGDERGRGPDNEPLVECREPLAWLDQRVVEEAVAEVDGQSEATWGPLDRAAGHDGG